MNIERLIREAHIGGGGESLSDDWIRRFAALVAEECAKVCDIEASGDGELTGDDELAAARLCAKNIRDAFRQ